MKLCIKFYRGGNLRISFVSAMGEAKWVASRREVTLM